MAGPACAGLGGRSRLSQGLDPFVPGPFSVGTCSGLVIDRDRDSRQLPFEVWYLQGGGKREVPALFSVAERDRFTPLAGQHELFARTPSRKRMFILRHAHDQHFADEVPEPGLCPPEQAHLFTRGLGLAHFDAVLGGNQGAQQFIEGDRPQCCESAVWTLSA